MLPTVQDEQKAITKTLSTREQTRAALLARELLNDIELGSLPSLQLLMKGARLARMARSGRIERWLDFELRGYPPGDPAAAELMRHTRRWKDER